MRKQFALLIVVLATLASCKQKPGTGQHIRVDEKTRIVSLNPAITEVLCAAGYEKNIVGIDLTSTFPASMQQLPKLGHIPNIPAEGVLAVKPNLVFARKGDLKPELEVQLEQSGVQLVLLNQEYTLEGTHTLLAQLADTIDQPATGKKLAEQVDQDLKKVQPVSPKPKVLFIYARGSQMLMVAGEGTKLDNVIKLAGADNAVKGFENFKPLSSETLVTSNPDVILLFASGLQSLNGAVGLEGIPGMTSTKAWKNKAVITMDDNLLSGFGPRLGQAAAELNQKLRQLTTPQ